MNELRRVFRLAEHEGDLEFRRRLAEKEAAEVDEKTVLTTDVAVLAAAIIDDCAAQVPRVLMDDIWSERREKPTPEGQSVSFPELIVHFHAPVMGAAQLLLGQGVGSGAFGGPR